MAKVIAMENTITTMIKSTPLLHLMHLASPALPVGAYAYSQGLETAVEERWVVDRKTAEEWVGQIMQHSLGRLDVPVLLRLFDAWRQQDGAAIFEWNQVVQAARESRELLFEDVQMGQALWRLLKELLGEVVQQAIQLEQKFQSEKNTAQNVFQPSFATAFALAATHWDIDKTEMAQAFVWSWLENQVASAIKLVPLGQTEAQHLLINLMPQVEQTVTLAAEIEDEKIGSGLPRLAMASMKHEVQYSRLFRS